MNKNPFVRQDESKKVEVPFCLATVSDVNAEGATLLITGSAAPTRKRSKVLQSASLKTGDRVLCARISDTSFIVLGKYGA